MVKKGDTIFEREEPKKIKWACQICKIERRRLHRNRHGQVVCWKCYMKDFTRIGESGPTRRKKSIVEVLNAIHEPFVRVHKKRNVIHCVSTFPRCMAGKRFRIVLVDENGNDIPKEEAIAQEERERLQEIEELDRKYGFGKEERR